MDEYDEYGIEEFSLTNTERIQIQNVLSSVESFYQSIGQSTKAIEKAKWIIEMQKKQSLLKDSTGCGENEKFEYFCPNCGFMLRKGNVKHQDRCCPMCGQVLDWEETEEEEENE